MSPNSPPSLDSLPKDISALQSSVRSIHKQVAHSRLALASSMASLHNLYRQVLEQCIRILEQTIHGAMARGTKAKAEYLATMAEGMSKKLALQHSQLLQQVYSPEMQAALKQRLEKVEGESRMLRQKVRQGEATLDAYGKEKAFTEMASEYAEVLKATETVREEIRRLGNDRT